MKRKRKCLQITSGIFEGALLTTDKKTGKLYVLKETLIKPSGIVSKP